MKPASEPAAAPTGGAEPPAGGAELPPAVREAERGRLVAAFLMMVLVFLAARSYRPVLELGHVGWDTWPMIASSKVASAQDLVDTFREELMDGRYPLGRFYRPATNLTFALDHARAGSAAGAYHQTDLAILLAAAIAVFALARRLFASSVVGLAAAAWFALHPLHFEVLPVSARRADTQSVLGVLLAVWFAAGSGRLQSGGASGGGRPRAWRLAAAGFATLLAAASKESGVLAAPLVLGVRWIAAHEAGCGARSALARSVRESAWAWAAVALFVLARTLVLGGLGGHASSSLTGGFTHFPSLASGYARELLVPQPWSPWSRAVLASGLGAALLIAAVLLLVAGRGREALGGRLRGARAHRPANAAGALLFVVLWGLAALVITGVSGEVQPWYGIPLLAPAAVAGGWVLGRGLELAAGARSALRARSAGALGVLVGGLLLGSHVAFSGLFREYPAWPAIDAGIRGFLEDCAAAVEGLGPGGQAARRGLPLGLRQPPGAVGIRSAAGIEAYGVQAYFDLEHPGRNVRVVPLHRLPPGSQPAPPGPDEIVLFVAP